MNRRTRQVVVEVPEHVDVTELFDAVADAAHAWEGKQPARDWDVACYSTVVEHGTVYGFSITYPDGTPGVFQVEHRRDLPPGASMVERAAWYGPWKPKNPNGKPSGKCPRDPSGMGAEP